jgi:hypothetical protein
LHALLVKALALAAASSYTHRQETHAVHSGRGRNNPDARHSDSTPFGD